MFTVLQHFSKTNSRYLHLSVIVYVLLTNFNAVATVTNQTNVIEINGNLTVINQVIFDILFSNQSSANVTLSTSSGSAVITASVLMTHYKGYNIRPVANLTYAAEYICNCYDYPHQSELQYPVADSLDLSKGLQSISSDCATSSSFWWMANPLASLHVYNVQIMSPGVIVVQLYSNNIPITPPFTISDMNSNMFEELSVVNGSNIPAGTTILYPQTYIPGPDSYLGFEACSFMYPNTPFGDIKVTSIDGTTTLTYPLSYPNLTDGSFSAMNSWDVSNGMVGAYCNIGAPYGSMCDDKNCIDFMHHGVQCHYDWTQSADEFSGGDIPQPEWAPSPSLDYPADPETSELYFSRNASMSNQAYVLGHFQNNIYYYNPCMDVPFYIPPSPSTTSPQTIEIECYVDSAFNTVVNAQYNYANNSFFGGSVQNISAVGLDSYTISSASNEIDVTFTLGFQLNSFNYFSLINPNVQFFPTYNDSYFSFKCDILCYCYIVGLSSLNTSQAFICSPNGTEVNITENNLQYITLTCGSETISFENPIYVPPHVMPMPARNVTPGVSVFNGGGDHFNWDNFFNDILAGIAGILTAITMAFVLLCVLGICIEVGPCTMLMTLCECFTILVECFVLLACSCRRQKDKKTTYNALGVNNNQTSNSIEKNPSKPSLLLGDEKQLPAGNDMTTIVEMQTLLTTPLKK